ncbi:hypothetical protein N0V95_003375 [Ascochyta clinopodiicola]|nr:hypothetical protein N0V95_003375 [Ascochyta clinopodiicola]
MMYGLKYGSYVHWQYDAAHRLDIMGYPRGRLILEAQATLLKFLRHVLERLLHDLHIGPPVSLNIQGLTINATFEHNSAWSEHVFRPYIEPPKLDFDACIALAKARVDATDDRLWLLQTDPAFLKRYIRTIEQMQQIQNQSDRKLGLAILSCQIDGEIDIHEFWLGTCSELEHVRDVYSRFRDSIVPGCPMPAVVDKALGALDRLLFLNIDRRVKQLDAMIYARPGFQNNFEYRYSESGVKQQYLLTKYAANGDKASTSAAIYRADKLFWLLSDFLGDPDSRQRIQSYAATFAMLDDHLESSPKSECARLNEILYEKLTDLAALLELLSSIRMHRPAYAARTKEDCLCNEKRLAWRLYLEYSMASPSVLKAEELRGSTRATALRSFKSTPPPNGQRNLKWLQEYDTLHNRLQLFWEHTYNIYRDAYKELHLQHQDNELLMQSLLHWEQPEYRDRLAAKHKQVLTTISKSTSSDAFLPLPASDNGNKTASLSRTPTKTKTRGPQQVAEVKGHSPAEPVPGQRTQVVPLSKRSLATLRPLFPQDVEER